tara:strand:+ start:14180 stop:15733 length:1554 start_codon:yes stop_codon:yes gene_type:complete
MIKIPSLPILLFLIFLFSSCQFYKYQNTEPASHPTLQKEFRAAWVASVANINWPSSRGLSSENQKKEAIELLDLLQKANYNAVIFQVRPQADALYKSDLEPWSYYLSGKQGVPPDPYYDPLEFWIEEAHKRGLELHAWMNPYRAHHIAGGEISQHSVVNTKSDLVVSLKTGYWWFDPSIKETQDHTHKVVMDIVKRYDIDGVHFDDYFYPYPSYNNDEDFPDDESWNTYKSKGGKLSRGDWRRNSVDTFIQRVYTSIKKEKTYVKFGISPFGIWRPQNPPSIQGFDQYEVLYADAKKWLNEGWVDYFSPQLYWPVNQIPQSFPVLLGWWKDENKKNRHIWPGISLHRFEGEKQTDETINQIMITRGMIPNAPGTIHWSIAPLIKNDTLRQAVKKYPYSNKSLIPSLNWISSKTPKAPNLSIIYSKRSHVTLDLSIQTVKPSLWVLYSKYNGSWNTKLIGRNELSIAVPYYEVKYANESSGFKFGKVHLLEEFQITYIDRYGIESAPFIYKSNIISKL